MKFTIPDIIVFLIYCAIVASVGIIVSRKVSRQKDTRGYFFAGNSLPWYLVGSSVIAANISAEQFIGMSGSGYAMGITIATYEWLAAIMLIMVALWFLPVFIEKKIYTMPQFLEVRYDHRVKTVLAFFWLFLFVFVNLTSILYLGALSLKTVFGIKLGYAITGLALFSLLLTVGGGLRAIANTDIIQVLFLVLGGLTTTYLALDHVSEGNGVLKGFSVMINEAPEKFHMILERSDPNFRYMPGIRSILGGIWIAGIYYFGANQYIIQKALGAKSLREAQRGMLFAGYLKLIIPVLVVIPGIAAFVLNADIAKPDEAYPWLLNRFVPSGIRGFVFAALIAAIVSSLAAIINSASTIFSIDIFKVHFKPDISEESLVKTGKICSLVIVIIAALIASMLKNIEQVFQFIQEYTGLVSPGITAMFVLGLFWKKTTSHAAWIAVLLTLPVPVILKLLFPGMPFLDNMVCSFLVISSQMIIVSLSGSKEHPDKGAWELPSGIFRNKDRSFILPSLGILLILCILYYVFW
ncbi:MAG TPA: sodium/glucose cotransporter [Bacteroidales bacterium]|nr:sodium/glucose cotransporter [Bacteroidales bacterium]